MGAGKLFRKVIPQNSVLSIFLKGSDHNNYTNTEFIMKTNYLLLLFLLLASCSTKKGDIPKTLSTEDQELLNYLFPDKDKDAPGYSYFVIKDGQLILDKSIGFANIEKKVKNNSNTVYKITSVSKQFSAMAIMILVHRGKITYETKLTEVFPDFPSYGEDIDIRHLLTHQSGLISYYEFIDEGREEQLLNDEIFTRLQNLDSTNFKPGSEFRYGGTSYAIITNIVEKVTGTSFENFMQREVFKELEMNNTSILNLNEPIEDRALGYYYKNDSISLNDKSITSAIIGAKGVYTTVNDFLKWDQALYTDKIIPQAELQEAFINWNNNEKNNDDGHGYGWYINYENGTKVLNYYGESTGFTTQVKRIPELQFTVGIFSNYSNNYNIQQKTNALISIYSGYKLPMPIEILMNKLISENGIQKGIAIYDSLKANTRYKYEKSTLSLLGSAYYRETKEDEAKILYEKSIEEYPDHFGGYFGLGRIFKKSGDKIEAIKNFKKALQLDITDHYLIEYVKKELEELEVTYN